MERKVSKYGFYIKTIFILSVSFTTINLHELYAQPIRPANQHFSPYVLSNIRANHPRLWFNSDNLTTLKNRWNDPQFQTIVDQYKSGNDAISWGIKYLATQNSSDAQKAISSALNAGSNGERKAAWGDIASIIFDWCYDQLNDDQKNNLLDKIKQARQNHKKKILDKFQFHENHILGLHAYVTAVLAIEGESGVTSELQDAQNILQNLCEMTNEISGDGGYRAYWYQGSYQPLPFFLWTSATNFNFVDKNSFIKNLHKFAVHRLAVTGNRFVRSPGDDAADETGYMMYTLSAGIFYMIADIFNDPLSQWFGNTLTKRGQKTHWAWNDDPSWLSLIYYNPTKQEKSPQEMNIPLNQNFDKIGMVSFQSGWKFDSGINETISAWFFNGPSTSHSNSSQNHFIIWRGEDDLAITGGNYFGRPSTYTDHYFKHSIARNTLIFSPLNSNNPDKDGGQINRKGLQPNSAEKYPLNHELNWYKGLTSYSGEIVNFEDTPQFCMVSGDAGIAYDHDHVKNYIRDFIYIKPNIYLIRDRFTVDQVANIRWLLHSRTKPVFDGQKNIVKGNENAGIIEGIGEDFFIEKGESRLTANILWPNGPKFRFIGGKNFEHWVDGANSNPETDAQSWLLNSDDLQVRMGLSVNQWRTEVETAPDQANGEIIVALFVSEKGPTTQPEFKIRESNNKKVVFFDFNGKKMEIVFPLNQTPIVQSAGSDNSPPDPPKNVLVRKR